MITDEIVEAIDNMIDMCSDKKQQTGMISLREMLCDLDEDNWSSMDEDERSEWLAQFLSCKSINN